jgi:hypothetical protein
MEDSVFIFHLIEDLKKCCDLNVFKQEKIDSLPYKLEKHEVLLYKCLYPLLRSNYNKEVIELKMSNYIEEKDLGYFILGMIHNKLNGVVDDELKLLISAKEMKYQDHIKSVIEERFQDDYYLQKASTIKSNINDTLIFSLLIYNIAESDTMVECGMRWKYEDTLIPKEFMKTYLRGIVKEKFVDPDEGNSIYYKINLIKMEKKYLKYYDSTYTVGSEFPLNMLKHGGEIEVE